MTTMNVIPTPAFSGRLLAKLDLGNTKISVYWNTEIDKVLLNNGRHWFLTNETNTLSTIRSLCKNTVPRLQQFQLYEHGVEITSPNDFDRFQECEWRDYAYDNFTLFASFHLEEISKIPGGE